jgi:hypothetical protein
MLTRRSITALAAALLVCGPLVPGGAAGNGGFLTAIEDMPLMPGLIEVADAGTVFETAKGRIVEAWAEGNVTMPAVIAFYDATLPQLGWERLGDGTFERDGETLRIDRIDGGAQTTVRFTVTPD